MTIQQLKIMPIEQRFRLFVKWLGNQPEDGTYRFFDTRNCAMCQFAKSLTPCGAYIDTYVSAGATYVYAVVEVGIGVQVELMPTGAGSGLHRDVFGLAYDDLALIAGLPRRAKRRAMALNWLARCVKRRHPLAA